MNPNTITMIWLISIALLIVVTGVVAWLLSRVLKTSRSILSVAGDIWTTGKLVANNTIHIPLLGETNRQVQDILETAAQIVDGASAIEQHAEGCPGCPQCVLE